MAAARKLLDAGKAAEALATLEKASQKAPGESRLRSLLAIVRESAEQEKTEKTKTDYIQKANEARRRKDYKASIKVLETAQTKIQGPADIQKPFHLRRSETPSLTHPTNSPAAP